ncbi:hypothetical protein DHEL01_v211917 [Diaporthe helianthi]|uniref:N-acetyltransferase domain-containing protein n=1 Tax=Diaporthe helianthi TaxID=158607 RepID=A0A2P5HHG7_DIAHE|nr:hypothetical protein DHEL01_v211917 [Diaporthe helianthi]
MEVALVSDEEMPTFVEVMSKAFGHDAPFVDIYFPNHDTPAGQVQLSKRLTAWKQGSESSTFLKAVTRTDNGDQEKTIGIAIWTLMKEAPASEMAEAENVEEVWPVADDREFMTELWREYVIPRTHSVQNSDGKGIYALELLAVHPNHRRLGAGRALVEWETKASDEQGVKAVVEGTPMGRQLYEKCGLSVQIEQMRFDPGQKFIGRRLPELTYLTREPQG